MSNTNQLRGLLSDTNVTMPSEIKAIMQRMSATKFQSALEGGMIAAFGSLASKKGQAREKAAKNKVQKLHTDELRVASDVAEVFNFGQTLIKSTESYREFQDVLAVAHNDPMNWRETVTSRWRRQSSASGSVEEDRDVDDMGNKKQRVDDMDAEGEPTT